jgi:hypothetical protein
MPSPLQESFEHEVHHPDEESWELRHGYEDQYSSEEYLQHLNAVSHAQMFASSTIPAY